MNNRPDWSDYFLSVAKTVALRGDCRRRKVGALIVVENRILSTGYNGTSPKGEGCLEGKCPRGNKSFEEVPSYSSYEDCIAIHAETNAINGMLLFNHFLRNDNGASNLTRLLREATIVVSEVPCSDCKEMISGWGIPKTLSPEGVSEL